MFDFQNAEINKGSSTPSIIKPGIHVVKTDTITNGVSQNTQAPYLEWTVIDSNGSKLSNRYFLNTSVAEGKTKSAWDISKNAILAIVAACNNYDETTAKSKMPNAKSVEELAQKLSALCVGKEFKLKVTGEEKMSQDGTKKYIISLFGSGVFAESTKVSKEQSTLKYSDDKNIKRLPELPTQTQMASTTNSAASNEIGW